MSSTDQFNFTASAQGVMADFAVLTLYDGNLNTIATGYGYVNCRVPHGLFKLNLTLNESSVDKYVSVEKDTYEVFPTPATSSAIVADGFKDSHEYYSNHVSEYSIKTTADLGYNEQPESLFLFFRYPDEQSFKQFYYVGQRLTEHFTLLDSKHKVICQFRQQMVAEETTNYGWLAFNARLAPGNYFLHYSGRKPRREWNEKVGQLPREIPIWIYRGWQTQCFMTFGKGPLFSSMTLSMTKADPAKREVETDINDLQYLDAILQKFRNGIYYLPDNTLLNLAHQKFKNPILGLLAAYAYFKSGKNNNEQFFKIVVDNLTLLLGTKSPDIIALQLVAAAHFGQRSEIIQQRVSVPGMMLPGFSELLSLLSVNNESLIKAHSIAEKASTHLYYDMVWTSYIPISTVSETTHINASGKVSKKTMPFLRLGGTIGKSFGSYSGGTISFRGSYFPKRSESKPVRKSNMPVILSSWIASSLVGLLEKSPSDITIPQLATQLQVTPNVLLSTTKKVVAGFEAIIKYFEANNDKTSLQHFSAENKQRLEALIHQEKPALKS
ncbi:MAG: hypothetical protein ACXVB6_17635 [Mucilaginibacter sp.]